jgi:hypothetical protein
LSQTTIKRRLALNGLCDDRLMHLRLHEAVTALAKETEPQSAYAVLEGQARLFARWLGFDSEAEESVWTQFPSRHVEDVTLYEAVRV